jgi:hypothetical protein
VWYNETMIPLEPPKDASVFKDGDRWTAIVAGDRFERFRSEDDAWGWILCLCTEDDLNEAGEVGSLDFEIAEHQRVLRIMKAELLNPPSDPDERARLKRSFILTQAQSRTSGSNRRSGRSSISSGKM